MNIRYHLRAWAFLVLAFTPWKVQAQDQNYNEDWVALAEVPRRSRSSAEKAVTGAGSRPSIMAGTSRTGSWGRSPTGRRSL